MSDTLFLDCFGRTISIGDVLAHGYRDGNIGCIGVGVVRAIDDKGIHVDAWQRGTWHTYKDGSGRQWWLASERGNAWRIVEKRHTIGTRCFITGLTEAGLHQIAGISEKQGKQ